MPSPSEVATTSRLRAFGTSIFSEMSQAAARHGAINLSQGFPDFDGPPALLEAAARALSAGHNQYARSQGDLALVTALAADLESRASLRYDPATEWVVTSGATEAITCALLGLTEPGDEVVLFEPFYDSYPAALAMAQAVPLYCPLRFPDYRIREEDLAPLRRAEKLRLLVLNAPHNPSGRVFSDEELALVARLCVELDLTVITDEVYEHLVYAPHVHRSLASFPGMRERTLRISSAGKSFSVTGWKVGWASGPARLVAALQAVHQFVTFSTATPLQRGLAEYLGTAQCSQDLAALQRDYAARREFLVDVLRETGFQVSVPEGSYFVMADFRERFAGDDLEFARFLVREVGVAAIPPSAFHRIAPEEARTRIRFAFCKKMQTLEAAAERLRRWKGTR